jgi:ATP-dependent protease ClpP protease subunit
MNWFSITHQANVATAYIGDNIGAFGLSAVDFIRDMGAASKVELRIDSGGGDGSTALATHAALAQIDCIALVTGRCCSAAILPLMAAKRISAYPGSMFMLHAPVRFVCGNELELRSAADDLLGLKVDYRRIVSARTGQSASTVNKWLSGQDRWFTAAEALSAGLVDELVDAPKEFEQITNHDQEKAEVTPGPTEREQFCLDMLRAIGPLRVTSRKHFLRELQVWASSIAEQ